MTFEAAEISNYDGRPINLYEFQIEGSVWGYTDYVTDITFAGTTYLACPCSDSGITLSGEGGDGDDLTVTLPRTVDFAKLYKATPPSKPISLKVRRRHAHDNDTKIAWVGLVRSTQRKDSITFDVMCQTLTSSLTRPGARLSWGRGCPYALYDRNCRVNRQDFALTLQVASFASTSFTVGQVLPTGYYDGGMIEFIHPDGYNEMRAIAKSAGNTITLLTGTDGLSNGAYVTLFAGCDRTSATCQGKFSNIANYGGFRHLPTDNPFSGNPF